jgi:hypothetical protein
MKLTIHLYLVRCLRMNGAIPLLFRMLLWRAQGELYNTPLQAIIRLASRTMLYSVPIWVYPAAFPVATGITRCTGAISWRWHLPVSSSEVKNVRPHTSCLVALCLSNGVTLALPWNALWLSSRLSSDMIYVIWNSLTAVGFPPGGSGQ